MGDRRITLELERRDGEDIDDEALRDLLDEAGYKVSSSAPGFRMLAAGAMTDSVRRIISAAMYGSLLTPAELDDIAQTYVRDAKR